MRYFVVTILFSLLSGAPTASADTGDWLAIFGGGVTAAVAPGFAGRAVKRAVEHKREREVRQEVTKRLNDAAAQCIAADYSKLSCLEEHTNDPDYDKDGRFTQTMASSIRKLNKPGLLTFISPLAAIAVYDHSSLVDAAADQADTELDKILPQFADKIKNAKLDTCHQACLVQCFTSKIVTYDDQVVDSVTGQIENDADRGADVTAGTGKGVCRNFSDLASVLGKHLGISLNYVATHGMEHIVVGYDDNDGEWLIEPQRNPLAMGSCQRYKVN